MMTVDEMTLAFLKWLSQHGIDPEIPLVIVSVLLTLSFQFTIKEWGNYLLDKKNLRRISVVVTAQTKWHLEQEAAAAGYGEKDLGRVLDKWSRTRRAEKAMMRERRKAWTNEKKNL